jgi:hypothetical protein
VREPVVLADDFGDVIEVEADENLATTPDGSISPGGAVIITFRYGKQVRRMRLSGERLTAFREAVDRAAMPRQVPPLPRAAKCPRCGLPDGTVPVKWTAPRVCPLCESHHDGACAGTGRRASAH